MSFLTFGFYIRSVLEINQYILVSSVNEVKAFNTTTSFRTISFAFACLLLIANFLLILFTLGLSFTNSGPKELFVGIKAETKKRLYLPALLIRRAVYVAILLTITEISSRSLIGILIGLQVVYSGYICYLRPFESTDNSPPSNLIESLNEIFFLVLLSALEPFNEESDWNQTYTQIYMWVLASNNIVTFLIVLSKICN